MSIPCLPYLAQTHPVIDADDLIGRFGEAAGAEAATRAARSRSIGNHLHFCRWRQVERLVAIMTVEHAVGTVH